MTRLVGVADLHGYLPPNLPDGDVLVIGGDVCPIIDHSPRFQALWLERDFYPWVAALPHEHVVWIAGNHDFVCERPDWKPGGRAHYLRDSGIEVAGVSIYGTPWVPHLPSWAFHAGEEELAERVGLIPPVDVLVSHGPPHGIGDRVVGGERAGSPALTERLEAVPPQLCLFGHIHEDHGQWRRGATELANVAQVDEHYRVRIEAAQAFDLEPGAIERLS